MLIGQAHHLKQIIQKLNVELTGVSLLQLGTAKLFAYAEVTKSEFNKISEIFPIFINLTRFSRFAFAIENRIQNSLFKIEGHISGIGSLLNFINLKPQKECRKFRNAEIVIYFSSLF